MKIRNIISKNRRSKVADFAALALARLNTFYIITNTCYLPSNWDKWTWYARGNYKVSEYNLASRFILRLKIKRNDWLLADTCPHAANHCALF